MLSCEKHRMGKGHLCKSECKNDLITDDIMENKNKSVLVSECVKEITLKTSRHHWSTHDNLKTFGVPVKSISQGDRVNCLFKSKQIMLQRWHKIINAKSFKGIKPRWVEGERRVVVSGVKSGWVFPFHWWMCVLSGCERSWMLSRGFARDRSTLLHKHGSCQEKTWLYKSMQIIFTTSDSFSVTIHQT